MHPEMALLAPVGTSGAYTLRKYNRTWAKVRAWLAMTYDHVFRAEPYQVIVPPWDGSLSRAREPSRSQYDRLSRSWKGSAEPRVKALCNNQPSLRALVNYLSGQLAAGTRHQVTEPILIGMMVAKEAMVVWEGLLACLRAYAWYRLVKLQGGLRADDMRGLPPTNLSMADAV